MKNQEKIQELTNTVVNSLTANVDGRQAVVNACKELYNLIEADVYQAGAEFMLRGMYTDLCTGNFAEPYMCECKKTDFLTVKKIYEDRILPRL